MTTSEARPEQLPAALYGGSGTDRFMRGLTAFSDSYINLMTMLRTSRGQTRPRRPGPYVPQWRKLLVAGRTDECDGVISLRLTAPSGGALPTWRPGAHLQVELPSGTVRHYSLCGDPGDRGSYRIAVRLMADGGGGSAEIHSKVTPGTALVVAGPRNAFPFAADPAVTFIAGGIGITPILPMVRKAAALGLDWRLVYAGRSRATMPFLAELSELAQRADQRVTILADDETGPPDCADLLTHAPAGAAVYVCGPPPMLSALRAAANQRPTEISGFHFERFTAPPIVGGHPFEVELARSGVVLPVPADRSVLDVLRAHDPATPYSCQQGFCGTCARRVRGGEVEHRDQRLTDDERAGGEMLVCVSRAPAGTRLVLDS